ncbi:nucleotide-diphospho-sugar transferase-domain-containing protein [Haematococcus lacustris]
MRRPNDTNRPRAGLAVAGLIVGVALVLSFALLFAYQHHYLDQAIKHHSNGLAGVNNVAPKWDVIWGMAQQSKSEQEFLTTLRISGLAADIGVDNCRRQTALASGAYDNEDEEDGDGDGDYGKGQQRETGEQQGSQEDGKATADGPRWLPGDHPELPRQLRPVDDGPPSMSALLAHSLAVNQTLIVTWANAALLDFVQSWVDHVRRQGYTNFLVGAMDKEIGQALVSRGIPAFAMYERSANHSGVGEGHLDWGGASFHKMGRQKISLAQLFLRTGLSLLLVDVDAIVLGDVLAYFQQYPQADILVSSDMLGSKLASGDTGLELPRDTTGALNIGIMFFRYSPRTLTFVNRWLDVINADDKVWDQNAFNELARAGWDPITKLHPEEPRLYMGFNGSLALGTLPVASFSGGHTFFIQRLYEVKRVQPLMVHCTFQYGANAGKRNRMREAMLFNDPPEYFTGASYVSVAVPKAPSMGPTAFAALNYTEKKAYNVQGLHMQLDAVYAGIGLAAMFNRSIIVPRIACYCDRYWGPLEDCRLPGAAQERLPFVCPMDYVLDPIGMTDAASSLLVSWREHAFLDNPRCPQAVRTSRLTVYSTEKAAENGTDKWSASDGGAVLLLRPGLPEAKLGAILARYSQYRVWHFMNPSAAWASGFSSPEAQEAYRKRIDRLAPVVQPDNM